MLRCPRWPGTKTRLAFVPGRVPQDRLQRLLPASCLSPTRVLDLLLETLLSCGGEEAALLARACGAGLGGPFPWGVTLQARGATEPSLQAPSSSFLQRCLVSRMYVLLAFVFFLKMENRINVNILGNRFPNLSRM